MTKLHWGYDFTCGKSVDAILAAFNAAGPCRWRLGDSDIYGFYLKCQPKDGAEIRVYERRQFRLWRPGDRGGFYAEFESDAKDVAVRPQIARNFLDLLHVIKAKNIVET